MSEVIIFPKPSPPERKPVMTATVYSTNTPGMRFIDIDEEESTDRRGALVREDQVMQKLAELGDEARARGMEFRDRDISAQYCIPYKEVPYGNDNRPEERG